MTRWGSRLGLLAILAGTAALRLRLLAVPLERDEGEYAYMGQLILRGETPYVAAHNMKLPGVYYAYAGILGAASARPTSPSASGSCCDHAARRSSLLYLLGRRLLDATAGLTAAAAYAVLSLEPGGRSASPRTPSTSSCSPMLGGVLLLAPPRRRDAGAHRRPPASCSASPSS